MYIYIQLIVLVCFHPADAVTVVLYQTVEGMNCIIDEGGEITPAHYGIAFAKFIVSNVGGIAVGVIFGALTAFLTKHTVETRGKHSRDDYLQDWYICSQSRNKYIHICFLHFRPFISDAVTHRGVMKALSTKRLIDLFPMSTHASSYGHL